MRRVRGGIKGQGKEMFEKRPPKNPPKPKNIFGVSADPQKNPSANATSCPYVEIRFHPHPVAEQPGERREQRINDVHPYLVIEKDECGGPAGSPELLHGMLSGARGGTSVGENTIRVSVQAQRVAKNGRARSTCKYQPILTCRIAIFI